LLSDAELRELFVANGLDLLRERREKAGRDLSAYLDLAGSEGDLRARAEALAAGNASLLVEEVGWYLLLRA
jgi:hypothetical protein